MPHVTDTRSAPPTHRRAKKHKLKEAWLNAAVDLLRPYFKEAGYDIPEHVRLSTGWPSRAALGKKRAIGQAWSHTCSADGVHEIIVSLYLDEPELILATLAHDLIHVTVGVDKGHKRPFSEACRKLDLLKPWTATTPGAEFKKRSKAWVRELGIYPHAKLDGRPKEKKQGCRLLGLTCPDCGCKVRITRTWLDTYGEFSCPCGSTFEENQ